MVNDRSTEKQSTHPFKLWGQAIGRAPGLWPAVGAGPAALGRMALGAGVGYGLGAISTGNRKARRMGALFGGGLGLAASGPDLYSTLKNNRGLIDKWPYDQPTRYDSAAPVPGQNPVDAFDPGIQDNFAAKYAEQDVG